MSQEALDEMVDMLYVATVRGIVEPDYPLLAAVADENIVSIGHLMCDMMGTAGEIPPDVMFFLVLGIVTDEFDDDIMGGAYAGALLGAAPDAYCPENKNYMLKMLDSALSNG